MTADLKCKQSWRREKEKARAKAQRDGRRLTTTAALRKVFKEIDTAGSFSRLNFFEAGAGGSTNFDALVISAASILRAQHAALQQRHLAGGRLCVLHWQFDGTPQRVAFQP